MRIHGIKPLGVTTAGGLKISTPVSTLVTWITAEGNLGSPYQGQSFQRRFEATANDSSPVSYQIIGGSLPQGMTLDPDTGVLTGQPLGPSALYSFMVQARAGSARATRAFSIAVQSLNIIWETTQTTFAMNGGHTFYQPLSVRASNGSQVFLSVVTGTLPTGLSLSTTGILSGRPNNQTGTTIVTIRAQVDGFAVHDDRQFTINVVQDAVVWQTAGGNLGTVQGGKSFTRTLTAVSDPGDTITYTVRNGLLPTGLTLNSSTGVISGVAGNYGGLQAFTIRASDGTIYADRDFSITVDEDIISWNSPPSGSLGTYLGGSTLSATFSATSDNGEAVTYSISAGALPGGLTLAPNGSLSGTLTNTNGISSFTVRAASAVSSSSRTFSITVSRDDITWKTSSTLLIDGDTPTEVQLAATSTSGRNITYSRQSGALPTGMTLASNGLISGTATVPGVHTVTARADNGLITSDKAFSINVNAAPIWQTPEGVLGTVNAAVPFRFNLLAIDPDGIASYTVTTGNLPLDGVTLDSVNGTLSGTFGLPPEFTPPVWSTARDLGTFNETAQGNIVVVAVAANDRTLRSYTIVNGQLPAGVGFNPNTGRIAGTFGSEFGRGLDPDVFLTPKPTWNSNAALGTVNENGSFSQSLSASPLLGNTITNYAVVAGKVPLGLTLNAAGVLAGTVGDQNAFRIVDELPAAPTWSTVSGSLGTYEEDVQVTLSMVANTVAGRTIKYSLLDGNLPAGITLASNGSVSGLLSNDNSASIDPDVFKLPVPVWSTSADLGTTNEGAVISKPLSASPMRGNSTSYAIVDGTIPWGLTVSTAGLLSGTIGNQNPKRAPGEFTDAPAWNTLEGTLGTFEEEVAISRTVVATPVTGRTLRYAVISGHLPGDVTFASNGAIQGVTGNQNSPVTEANVDLLPKPTWVTAEALGTADEGTAVSKTLIINPLRGNAITNYAVIKGVLPWGVTLGANTGIISGTLANQNPVRAPEEYTVGPTWTTAAGSLGTVEEEVNVTRTVVAAPVAGRTLRYGLANGHLPGGMTLAANGVITGLTSNENSFGTDTDAYLTPKPTWNTAASMGSVNEGASFSRTLSATPVRGSAIASYAVVGGKVPDGLILNANGALIGTIGDQNPPRDSTALTSAPTWTTAAGSLGTINTSTPVNFSLVATPGSGRTIRAYHLTALMPFGLILNSATGVISGTADFAVSGKTISFSVRVIDNTGAYSDRAFSITIQ